MADPIIRTTQQIVEVTEVGDVQVTTIEQDDDGNFVRLISILGDPLNESGDVSRPLLFQLRIKSPLSAALAISSPSQDF